MSWNLLVAVEQEQHDNIVRPMILPRVHRGITSTAHIGVGDTIDFDGIDITVNSIRHKHQGATSDIAPVTEAYSTPHRPLSDHEIVTILMKHGFKDLG